MSFRGLALASLVVLGGAQAPFPARVGFVNDYAQAIDAGSSMTITRIASRIHRATGGEIVVVVLRSNARYGDDRLAERIAAAWGLWREMPDEPPSILLVYSLQEGDVGIGASHGVGDFLDQATLGALVRSDVFPHFEAGRTGRGLLAFVERVAQRYEERFGIGR